MTTTANLPFCSTEVIASVNVVCLCSFWLQVWVPIECVHIIRHILIFGLLDGWYSSPSIAWLNEFAYALVCHIWSMILIGSCLSLKNSCSFVFVLLIFLVVDWLNLTLPLLFLYIKQRIIVLYCIGIKYALRLLEYSKDIVVNWSLRWSSYSFSSLLTLLLWEMWDVRA